MADCYYVAGYVASSCIYFALQHLLVDYVMLERVVHIVERVVYLISGFGFITPGFTRFCDTMFGTV
jgi:cytochrome b subunit of formate dehydrogenase